MVSRRNNNQASKVQTATDSLDKILKNLNKNYNEPYISLATGSNLRVKNNIDITATKKEKVIPVIYHDLRSNYIKDKNIQNKNNCPNKPKLINQPINKQQIQSSDSDIAFDTNDIKQAIATKKLKYGTIMPSNDIKKSSVAEKFKYGKIISSNDIKKVAIAKKPICNIITPPKTIKCTLDNKNKPNYKKEITLPQNLEYKKLFEVKDKKIINFKNNIFYSEDLNKRIENEKNIIISMISKIDYALSSLDISNINNKILQDSDDIENCGKKKSINQNSNNIKYLSPPPYDEKIYKNPDKNKPPSLNIKINNITKINKDKYHLI